MNAVGPGSIADLDNIVFASLVLALPALTQVATAPVPIGPKGSISSKVPDFDWKAAKDATSYEIKLSLLDKMCTCLNAEGDGVCMYGGESVSSLAADKVCSGDSCHYDSQGSPTEPAFFTFRQCEGKVRAQWAIRSVNKAGKGKWSDPIVFWYEIPSKEPSSSPASHAAKAPIVSIIARNNGSYDNTYELYDNVCEKPLSDFVLKAHGTGSLELCKSPQGYGSFKSRIKGNSTWNNHDLLSAGQTVDL
jgi:hypothetical protein